MISSIRNVKLVNFRPDSMGYSGAPEGSSDVASWKPPCQRDIVKLHGDLLWSVKRSWKITMGTCFFARSMGVQQRTKGIEPSKFVI